MFRWLRSQISSQFRSLVEWSPQSARRRLQRGAVPARMRVNGRLDLSGLPSLRALPGQLSAAAVDVTGCHNLRELPADLQCVNLVLRQCGVECLPSGIRVTLRIDAEGCRRLRSIGAFRVEELVLRGCTALTSLAEGLRTLRLDLSRCSSLTEIPRSVARSVELLDVSDCPRLAKLPDQFSRLQALNVSGCASLTELSPGVNVRSWIEVAGSGLRELPWSMRDAAVLWRGVLVSERVAFDPESITVDEILGERNQEMRRVMLERVGMQRFVDEAGAEIIDEDRDAGGVRRLLRIVPADDEPIVCVQVQCPSTGKRYLLRVPPDTDTCQRAVAWTAGVRNPRHYHPEVET